MAIKFVVIASLLVACFASQKPMDDRIFSEISLLQLKDLSIEELSHEITGFIMSDVEADAVPLDGAITNVEEMCLDGTLVQADCDMMLPLFYNMWKERTGSDFPAAAVALTLATEAN